MIGGMERTATAEIAARLTVVRDRIVQACQSAGRPPESVTLVAVSKQQPATAIAAAIAAGVRDLGENRVEEALPKMAEVARLVTAPPAWHMIGHVQRRKARYVTAGFALLHSLDSVALAGQISRYLVERETSLDVLLEINISGEPSKEGWLAHQWQNNAEQRRALWQDVAHIVALPGLRVRGLMTMAPIVSDAEQTRPVFAGLRLLRDALAADFGAAHWDVLSMGMSDDYPVAIQEGATLVRIGRAIFGPRR